MNLIHYAEHIWDGSPTICGKFDVGTKTSVKSEATCPACRKALREVDIKSYRTALEAISQSPHGTPHCDLKALADAALKGN